jgi:hypothetical protein
MPFASIQLPTEEPKQKSDNDAAGKRLPCRTSPIPLAAYGHENEEGDEERRGDRSASALVADHPTDAPSECRRHEPENNRKDYAQPRGRREARRRGIVGWMRHRHLFAG